MIDAVTPPAGQGQQLQRSHEDAMRRAAQALEASFLAEMLKSAGFGKAQEGLGGGAGEDQFSSFLVRAHAEALAEKGGIGLSESIFEALKERQENGGE